MTFGYEEPGFVADIYSTSVQQPVQTRRKEVSLVHTTT